MSSKKSDKSGNRNDVPNLSELFSDDVKLETSAGDIFSGPVSGLNDDKAYPVQGNAGPRQADRRFATTSSSFTQMILILNIVVLTGILVYLVRRPFGVISAAGEASTKSADSARPAASAAASEINDTTDPAALVKTMELGRHTTDVLDGAVSLQTAERLYASKEYLKAAYVYERLRSNLSLRTDRDEALADWLTLQMALCLQKTQEQELMAELFTRALNSRSPVVRALANYNLAFIQNHNRNFLEARRHAYQAMALLKTIEAYMPTTLEADCYFLAAESLTRYLLRIGNQRDDLPGNTWSDAQPIYSLPITDQEQLGYLLTEGMDQLSKSAIAPLVAYDPQRSIGAQWTAYALDAPLDQLLWQYASEAKVVLNLNSLSAAARQHKTMVYLPLVDRNYLAEVAVGAAGLVWRFDGQSGQVYDISTFEHSDALKAVLVREAAALWQRFLLRHRSDPRKPNAHYCLGQLYTMADQAATALGEYKLVATQYPAHSLAPYALLGSSRIKTTLRDFTGAQTDLNELLIRYPNSRITDEALLSLAEATMENGNYAEAAELFGRVYHLNINRRARLQSVFGLGKCAYEQGHFAEAAKWLTETLSLFTDHSDRRLAATCLMLGQALIQTEQYTEAAKVLHNALGAKLGNREYVRIALNLVEAELKQQHYVGALEIFERIPESRLTQEDSVDVMIAKARLYRQMDIPTPAIALLRRKIEFIAESRLRALLSLELAECYLQNGELTPARRELNEAMPHLPTGRETRRAAYLLAQIAYRNNNHKQAEAICLDVMKQGVDDESLRREVLGLLGALYTEQQAYDRAAMAYAGLLEPLDVQ